jgi:hypothetical protein
MRSSTAVNEKERQPTIARTFPPAGLDAWAFRHRGAIGIFNDPVKLNGKQKGEGE